MTSQTLSLVDSAVKKQPNPDDYRTIPALAAYLDRIADGSEVAQRNFRSFAVVQDARDGYKYDRVTVTLARNGEVEAPEGKEPTPDEQRAITEAFSKLDLPRSISATRVNSRDQCEKLGISTDEFELLDRDREKVVMVQQRVEKKDGEKKYFLPWTLWDDGKWRMMEPDGERLPLWKPPERRNKVRIMVHEGPKAARFVDWLVSSDEIEAKEARAKHPWAVELSQYEHWGWIGGAHRPYATDWAEVRRENAKEIVVACDNDQVGQDATRAISQALLCPMSIIKFGEALPPSFDLADPFPPRLWKERRGHMVYCGPSFYDCLTPATWATREVPPTGKGGRPGHVLRDEFAREWMFSIKPTAFVHRAKMYKRYSETQFNDPAAPEETVVRGRDPSLRAGADPGPDRV